jgi:hypothetical protein
MENETINKWIYRLTKVAFLVSTISLVLLMVGLQSSSGTSLTIWSFRTKHSGDPESMVIHHNSGFPLSRFADHSWRLAAINL